MTFKQLNKSEAKLEFKKLVKQFKENLEEYSSHSYNEAQTRIEYIDRFFKILGWDVSNEQGFAEQYKEVVNEDNIKVSGRTKAPDYSFRIGGNRKFFVEAKKPSINLKDESEPAFQLKRYAWNAKLPISILTNFKEFVVYECATKPSEKDKASMGRIFYASFDQYEEQFDYIFDTFSKEHVLRGSFDKFASSSKNKKGTAQVDEEFLKEIEKWRELLAKNIALRNKDLTIYELNFAVQTVIDRILFLRICEDNHIEKYGKLKSISEGTDVLVALKEYFKYADEKYDSGIFNLKNDKVTTAIVIDNQVLKSIINELYYPVCPYEFTVIGVEILGSVYEQFLGKTIKLTEKHQAKVEEKPEVKKAGGIFYTPSFIVNYIVEKTVGKIVDGKKPIEIEKLHILDPACGSGSFLIGAYSYLLNYHLNYYIKNDPKKFKKEVFQIKENQWALTSERKKKILLNNIFGIDIDPQAVEVTKLSLLLKVLENETKEHVERQLKLIQERVLPDLDKNILCGNSLIGPEFYQGVQLTLAGNTVSRRVNIFNWNDMSKGFGKIIGNGGFDIILGNPPYIQIQKLNEFYPEEATFYQKNYITAQSGNVDIYVPFIEKSLSLLNKNGVLGFICPNRFFTSEYGDALRKLVTRYNMYHLVNFRHYFVFENADIYTALIFIQNKKQQSSLIYKEIRDLYKNKSDLIRYFLNDAKKSENNFIVDEIKPNYEIDKKWYFMTEEENDIFQKIIAFPRFEQFYEEFFVGIQTSFDSVYILKYLGERGNEYHLHSVKSNKDIWLEKGILRPIIDNTNIGSYFVIPATDYVIFPYKIEKNSAILFTQTELEKNYPETWNYLKENKKDLENREKGKMKGNEWYSYVYPKNLTKQNRPKMLVPHVVTKSIAALDNEGKFCLDNVGANGVILKNEVKESQYYFLAILNSPIASFFISKTSIFLSGGFYATNKQFAGQIPIKPINFGKKNEKGSHDKIVELVRKLIEIRQKNVSAKLDLETNLFSQQSQAISDQINQILYGLYGISESQKKIVEMKLV